MIGQLYVPWTGDCAGLNILAVLLAVLLAVVLWTWRDRAYDRRLVVRLVMAVPLAFTANLARIVTLIAYRAWQYPTVESPQLHYFFGFLWVLPVLGWFAAPARDGAASMRRRWLEALHIAAALALLAPLHAGPAGWVVALCALALLLPRTQAGTEAGPPQNWLVYGWFWTAGLIALMRMESLWLPWLLGCPLVHRVTWRRLGRFGLTLLGTIPVLAWNPAVAVLALIGAGWWASGALRGMGGTDATANLSGWPGSMRVVVGMYFGVPFAASLLPTIPAEPAPLPSGAMVRRIEASARQVRLLDQSPTLAMVWYDAMGDGRYHTLEVCMRYRGVELQAEDHEPEVMTDGSTWYRQYFLQGGNLIRSYPEYLGKTSLPLSAPGTHVIMTGSNRDWSEVGFAVATAKLAAKLLVAR
ncbi:MAG: archaeosortase/exosortase family protein [Candidatus Synoicihabitans palmerolidicus]|nr:archaeosortase/exosortase family protein [Candidatus Synoicihabitans palmerolidicus]